MAALTTTLLAVTAATAIAGVGMQVYGAQKQQKAAEEQSAAQQGMIEQEKKAEAVRKQAMELDARRKQLEVIRTQDRSRALALANATAQGASGGSGILGGYGQISGQTGVNLLGISQGLQSGQQLFGINDQISQYRMNYASAGSNLAAGQGLSSLGGSLVSSAGTIGNLFGGFGKNYMNGGSRYTGGTGISQAQSYGNVGNLGSYY